MDYKPLLNENQLKAVSTNSQYVRVVAGAGSGKTRVLTYRISYLISEFNVRPSSIVAIAFTNKVANEMKERALKLLNGLGGGLTVSTFHSFCAKFLRKEIDEIGFPNNFTIMDEDDQTTLIKNIASDHGFKKNDEIVKYTIGYIAYHKCIGEYPSDIILDAHASDNEKKAFKFFHIYEDRKEKMLSLDFDDLLLKTIEILENCPDVRERWQNRISNILVDEFQDTNDVQYRLIKLLMKEDTALYVVGDPDQTIYTWRGANQNIILDFKKDFPLAETIILDRNYRSTKPILDAANKLIAHNKKRVPKDLYTENGSDEPVVVERSFTRDKEAEYVVNQIERIKMQNPDVKYRDIAILYRAAYLTLPFENELMHRRIPYQIYGGLKFFQRKEVKDVLAYFRLIYNSADDLSFERIINVPKRGIGDTTLYQLKIEKDKCGLSYFDYISNIEKYPTEVKAKHIMALTTLVNKINAVKKKLYENLEVYPKILEEFIADIGYFEYLASDDETAEERLANVKTLLGNIVDYIKDNPESNFEEYLQNATLQSSQDEIKDGDYVSLMTVHVAKGLEFDYVFVVSLIDGVFPSERTIIESGHDGEEEERRLCYVAFTRAKKRLYVSYNCSYSFVLQANSIESRFFREAGLVFKRSDYSSRYSNSFFSTEKNIGYFKDEPSELFVSQISDDGWKVGDTAVHDIFGRGTVVGIIDETILEIDFEQHGKKSIFATHPKIHKEKKGALA